MIEPQAPRSIPTARRPILIWLPLLFAVAMVAGLAVALLESDREDPGLVLLDMPLPAFTTAADAETGFTAFDQNALQGENGGLRLVNFFASWCAPCRIEHPYLLRLANEQHLPVYGIAYRDEADKAATYLEQAGDPYTARGLDRQGQAALSFAITGVPESFLIDAKGRIQHRIQGPVTELEYERLMEAISKLQQGGQP
jgi:cytochrome c biogenesis protein CcmG, thiol:disulfide interchange protein DsbE